MNNIITHNNRGGIVCQYPYTAPVIMYNNLWQNRPDEYVGCTPGEGNRSQEPGFLAAQQGDYRLRDDSPLKDAGHPGAEFNDADGSRSDMGLTGGPQPQLAAASQRSVSPPVELLQNSLSFQGLPGIIDIPTATMVPPGSVDVAFNIKSDLNVLQSKPDEQLNFTFAVGLLPRVTIGGRGTETNPDQSRDISANLQLLLLQEGIWWPAIAVGFQDISGGNAIFESNYLVASKSFLGRVRGTVGFGTGPDTLEGVFAGVEFALNRFITLMGEYDGDDINTGIRLFPLPKKFEAYGVPRPTVDLIWQDGNDFAWGISLRSTLGEAKFQAQRAARAHKRYHRWLPASNAEVSLQTVSEQLQTALIAHGFENVRVTMVSLKQDKIAAVVEYENRRYNRDELHGLGLVLGLTATRMPPQVLYMSMIVKEVNTPVLQFTTAVDDFFAFLNEQMSDHTFARQAHISQQIQWPAELGTPVAETRLRHRSWFKVDAILRPGIETLLFWDFGVADVRFRLLPDAFMHVTPGTVVNVRGNIPVTQTAGFRKPLDDPQVDRILLHQALRLPLGKWSRVASGMTQFSVGRFTEEEIGIANETAFVFVDGVLFFKSTLARVGASLDDIDRWVALANGRVRYPSWDLTLSVTGGLFRDGDTGITADVSRFFGSTEIGIFLRHSDHGSLAGIRLGVPLTPAKELKPIYVRPRFPELFTYEQRTTVFTDRNILRADIGRSLPMGHEIERVYWNRDRLYPVYIQQHVDTLKQAVRLWIDDGVTDRLTQGRR
jgi:hypothetical protein